LKKFFAAVFIIISFAQVFAGSELAGTTASNFIKIPPFARPAGMAEAFAAVSDSTCGLYYNPAGLASTFGFEAQITHVSWFQDLDYEFLAFSAPLPYVDWGRVGFAFAWFQVPEMNRTDALTAPELADLNSVDFGSKKTGVFSPRDFAIILGYAMDLRDNLSAGVSIKYINQSIDSYSGDNITADIGFLYRHELAGNFLRAGVSLSNLGSELKMNTLAFEPPKILKVGVSDRLDLFGGRLLAAAQAVIQADYDSLYSLGAEYWIQNIFALRCGYKFGAFNHPTLGAGVKYSGLEFDYAFMGYDDLGPTHRFSLLYSWGAPPVKLSVFPAVFSPNADSYLDNAAFTPGLKTREKLRSMKINIYDSAGLLAASFPAKAGDKSAAWDGNNGALTLPDGVYSASLEAEYETGKSESSRVQVEIDNTPPSLRLDAEPKLLKPGSQDSLIIPATFTLFASDRNRISRWQFLIWDYNKKLFYSESGSGEPPLSIIWDGKGTNGDYVETGRVYYYSLIAYDTVGNKSQTKPEAQVVLLREIKLTFSSDAIFDPGQADVKITAYGILKNMKKVIAQHPESEIIVSGHTDNIQPRGIKYKDNMELSKARADAVKFFMVNLLSMDEKKISTEGYGETRPVASNDTLEGRLKNRRVEITIKSTVYK